ncbi:MAG: O-antigen ligase family protein [bacterium]
MSDISAKPRQELSRHLVVPVLVVVLMTIPWFFGGREPMGMLVNALLAAILYVSWLVVSRHRALRMSAHPRAIILPLAGIVLIATLSLAWSITRFMSLQLLITLIQASIVLVVVRDIISDKLARRFIFTMWQIVALSVFVIGAYFFATGNYDRMTSLFYWANPLATYFLVALVVGMDLIRKTKSRIQQFWLLSTGLIFGGLILTYSRAGWMIGAILVGLMIHMSRQRKVLLKQLGIVLLIGVITASSLVIIRKAFFKTPILNIKERVTESAQSTSVTDRFAYWKESSVMFADRPLKGWGIGAYREIHPVYQESATTAGNNPHNSIMQSFVELGLVGAGLYLVAIGSLLRYAWQLANDKKVPVWRQSAMLTVIAVGLHSWLDLVTNYPVLILTLALFLAIALPPLRKRDEVRIRSWAFGIPLAIIGGVLALSLGITYYNYINSIDKDYVDVVGQYDFDSSSSTYAQIFKRPIYDTDYLSAASILYTDRFDSQKDSNPAGLNRAAEYARLAIQREPFDAKHRYALGNIDERAGRTSDALKNYRQAIELDPHDNPQYQISYAKLLRREGFIDEAIKALQPVQAEYTDAVIENRNFISIKPRVGFATGLLASLYLERNELPAARTSLERSRKILGQSNEALDAIDAGIQKLSK